MIAARTLFLTQCTAMGGSERASVMAGITIDWRPISDDILTAVRRQGRAGDETGIVGGEEDAAARDLLGLAQAADRDLRQNVLLEHVLRHRLDHLGGDIAGT